MKDTIKKQNSKNKKIRLRVKPILITSFFLFLLVFSVVKFVGMPISNIYIFGNEYLTDWEIIELAHLTDYPAWSVVSNNAIENKLKENVLISEVKVEKNNITTVNINIKENKPLFFDAIRNKTILYDGREINQEYGMPIMQSALTGELYVLFLDGMRTIGDDVLNKMSEITYSPDGVDDERILVTMTDGNYVYLTLKKFTAINDYNNIIKEFDNKKGILYLNSGGYFKTMEN